MPIEVPTSRPIIVAHRGLHHEQPENSLAAFRAAWAAGVEWCECDVQQDQHGDFIVMHDDTLDRTTTGTGPVNAQSAEQLGRLRLRKRDGSASTEFVPTLTQLLKAMKASAGLLLEIKPQIARGPLWDALTTVGGRQVVVQSFHRDVAVEA